MFSDYFTKLLANKDDLAVYTQKARKIFQSSGIFTVSDFLSQATHQNILADCKNLKDKAFFNTVEGNCYLKEKEPSLGAHHPLNMTESTSLGVIAFDQIPASSGIHQIYQSNELRAFIADILGIEKLHEYECHLGAVNIARMIQGNYLRWHFDHSDFVVSIPIQNAESEGRYQYIHNLKSDTDPNYDGVQKVLNGDMSQVQELETDPGSLILFQGKNTLHRVTPVGGNTDRYVLLLGYAKTPGSKSTDYLRKIRYGRT